LSAPALRRRVSASLVVLVYEEDPVADAVAREWGTLPATGAHVDGAAVRRLNESILVLRRSGVHIHDDGVDRRLPPDVLVQRPTLVFPSIHRSEQNVASLTVHPIGNLGPSADLGGRARTIAPADPRRMVTALRLLHESAVPLGLPATYEATHHGPVVEAPALFIEIGSGADRAPAVDAIRVLANVIPQISESTGDRVALAVGGGHYVPHFTDLALRRSWAFGHLISRHALEQLDRDTAARAYALSPGADGILFSRAQDAQHPALAGIGPRLKDRDAPERTMEGGGVTANASRSASGT
jgi:D-tyrosyl-tRNA(Tyr) deacylase